MPTKPTRTERNHGRPPSEPRPGERGLVELLATRGCPQAEIAVAAGISEPTLRRAFREQLATAWAHRRVDEINRWFELSEQGDLAATIFLLGAGFAARGAR